MNLTQKCFTFASATKVGVFCYRDVVVEICILPFSGISLMFRSDKTLQNDENLALHVMVVVNARCNVAFYRRTLFGRVI